MTTLSETASRFSSHEFQAEEESHIAPNVGNIERTATALAGAALAVAAIRSRSTSGLLLGLLGGGLLYRGFSGYCPLYGAMGVNRAIEEAAEPSDYFARGMHVDVTYIINKPADELFRFWRNFENLPQFMTHLQSVACAPAGRSHWVAKGPAGTSVEWDAEIINEEENRLIAWRSLDNADVDNAGSVRFLEAPGGRGTEVHVVLEYIPPAGRLGSTVAWLFGEEPRQQIQEDLRRFKQLMEAGEIPTTEGQPRGNCR